MAVESGTKYRLKYSTDGGTTFKFFFGATAGQSDNPSTFRELIHKDNPGDWNERIQDGQDVSLSVTFFLDQSEATRDDLIDLKDAGTIVPVEEGNPATSGSRIYLYPCLISNIGTSYAVRSNTAVNVSFVGTGPRTFTLAP